jgi:lysyl endopeptidase
MKKTILIFIIFAVTVFKSSAQISYGGQPYSFLSLSSALGSQYSPDSMPQVIMPKINLRQLLREDSIESKTKIAPWRYGKAIDVNLNLNNSGRWQTLENGDRLWRLSVKSVNAFSLNFIFSNFRLAEGSIFFIYSRDKKVVLGAFTNKNNRDNGIFSTTIIRGEEAVFEFYEPADMAGKSIIQLSKVIHAYKNIFRYQFTGSDTQSEQNNQLKNFGDSHSCNINVNCPVGVPWSNEKRAVAMILNSNGRICSGTLLNNVKQDCTPFFLTAKHCTDDEYLDKWVFMFKYESPNCNNIDGPTNFTLNGSTLLASDSASDFSLLRLHDIPPVSYDVYYAGWSAVDIPADSCVAIHHPWGDIKKISFESDLLVSSAWDSGVPDSHWTVPAYTKGTTERGSSGCPLINKYHRVIGQLHGGSASCDPSSGTDDNYGKFSFSWNKGSTAAYRLKDWLDPDNTGKLILNGKDCNHPTFSLDAAINEIDSLYTGNICRSFINPRIILQNFGFNTLRSADIYYGIDNGALSHYKWKGNLRYMYTEQISLSSLNFSTGKHTFKAYVTNPNDSNDQNHSNDTLKSSFNYVIGQTIAISVHTDKSPDETSWILKDSSYKVISSNPQLIANTLFKSSICLPKGCYSFTIYDSYGDGMCYMDSGFAKVTVNDSLLGNINGCKFKKSDSIKFCIGKRPPPKPITEIYNIFPNPNAAKEPLYIHYLSARNQPAECNLYDVIGQLVGKFSIENNSTKLIYLSNLSKGIYFFSLKDFRGTRIKKVVIM